MSFNASNVFSERSLVDALMDANNRLARESALDATLASMGTTFIGALRRGNELNWVNVGDSLLSAKIQIVGKSVRRQDVRNFYMTQNVTLVEDR